MQVKARLIHFLLIALIAVFVYSNTLSASFHLDDRDFIVANPWFKHFTIWPDLEQFKANKMFSTNVTETLRTRYIAYLTLYGNIKVGGYDVKGFHIVNIVIHIINAILIYTLILLTLQTPRMRGAIFEGNEGIIAMCAALVFVSHPLQTQAVTYISQRFASLVALFYIASVVAYIKWRLKGKGIALYILSLLCAVMAMMTKETAFTLPMVIGVYEFVFFEGGEKARQRLIALAPFALTMFIIPINILVNAPSFGEASKGSATGLSRIDYLITQITVIPRYLIMMFYPAGQNLDYDYPVYRSMADMRVISSALALAFILAVSAAAYIMGRKGRKGMLIVAFGIWWYFITLSVESSIIPLSDMIFEHRAYMPSAGIIMACTTGAFMLAGRNKKRLTAVMIVTGLIVIALSMAAYKRNAVWKDEITLWRDTVKKSPQKRRPHYNLSMAYRAAGMQDMAVSEYKTAIGLKPDYAGELSGMDETMEEVIDERIIEHYKKVLGMDADLTEVYNKFGRMYENRRNFDKAIELYAKALKEKPDSAHASLNLGNAYKGKGLAREAGKYYMEAIRLDPKLPEPHNNLGVLYLESNMPRQAVREFDAVLAINPAFPMARQMRDYARKMIR